MVTRVACRPPCELFYAVRSSLGVALAVNHGARQELEPQKYGWIGHNAFASIYSDFFPKYVRYFV